MNLLEYISLSVGFFYAAFIFSFLIGWLRTKKFKLFEKEKEESEKQLFISVILPAKNEATNIENILTLRKCDNVKIDRSKDIPT